MEKTGKGTRADKYGLFAQFDREVLISQTHRTIGPITLMTRVGGIIGVNKEFYWMLTLCMTNFFYLRKLFNYLFKK